MRIWFDDDDDGGDDDDDIIEICHSCYWNNANYKEDDFKTHEHSSKYIGLSRLPVTVGNEGL